MFKRKVASKYGAKKTVIDDIKFDSTIESKYYLHLKERAVRGEIMHLELQPSFILMDGFKRNGVKIRDIKYIADFKYFDVAKQKLIVADVKGLPTPEFKLKAKLFLAWLEKNNKEAGFHEVYWKAKQWEIIER